jgi:hypothetical protein
MVVNEGRPCAEFRERGLVRPLRPPCAEQGTPVRWHRRAPACNDSLSGTFRATAQAALPVGNLMHRTFNLVLRCRLGSTGIARFCSRSFAGIALSVTINAHGPPKAVPHSRTTLLQYFRGFALKDLRTLASNFNIFR